MKKILLLTGLLLIISPAFSTELSVGITYDSHQQMFPVGGDFALEETFADESSLSVGLAYKNAGAYTASIMYNKFFNAFMLAGGLNYDLSQTGINPGIAAGTGLVFKNFSIVAAGGANLDQNNIFKPSAYNCNADVIFDTSISIIDLSFVYSSFTSISRTRTEIGGGMIFTAYEQGVPATVDIIVNVVNVTDGIYNMSGISANAGLGINVTLPVLSVHLKTLVDVKNPGVPLGGTPPFSISLSTGFIL